MNKLNESEHKLAERVKELTCLYSISKLIENPDITPEGIIQGTVNLISLAFQYPEIVCTRIKFKNKEFRTDNFKKSEWKLASTLTIRDEKMQIEAYYFEDKSFLKEEESLLEEIGHRIKIILEQREIQQELKESEEKYRTISEQSFMGIIIVQDRMIKYANEYLPRILGFSLQEITKWSVLDFFKLIHPEDVNIAIKRFQQIQTESTIESNSYRVFTKSKKIIWIDVNSRIIQFQGNRAIMATLVDRTIEKRAEQQIKESEQKYRLIMDNANDLIAVFDQKLNNKYMNEGYKEILGYSKDELYKSNALEFIHPDDKRLAIESFRRGLKTGTGKEELRVRHKDGSYIWFDVKGSTFNSIDGELNALIISRDISKRKKAEEKLRELNNLKSEFLRRASHELKTPLISIKGYSDLILSLYSNQFEPKIIEYLNEIGHGCERLQYIINDILKSSQLESIDSKPVLQEEDLSFLIKFCVNELEPFAIKRNQSIELDIQKQLMLNIEKEEIHDVLSNLLSNAIKYTPRDGKIEVKTEIKDGFVVISVIDNGIGFTDDQKEMVFKRFGKIERYGQGIDLGIDGTGLGLYISKGIVESHGGKIWLESEGSQKGTSFYFTIPIT